jgi:6-pyruvoyltetrahydropterin/6-carboxytetrahydropterin synthase
MGKFYSTKVIELGSTAFRQPKAESHCKYLHGYQLKAKIWFACNELDENNWVYDFGGLKELKDKLQNQFDHKCIIAKNDTAKPAFKELERYGAIKLVVMEGVGIEKFAEYIFNEANTFVTFKTNNRVWVEKVEVFEHENNSAIFEKEHKLFEAILEKNTVKEGIENKVEPETVKLQDYAPKPAPIGNKTTTGWSNPFEGTRWGM